MKSKVVKNYFTEMTSISIFAFLGKAFTAKQALAGLLWVKY